MRLLPHPCDPARHFRTHSVAKQVHRFQEAVTRLALVRSGIPLASIHWGKKLGDPAGGIDADLIVAEQLDQPRQVIQVRHAGSSKEQEKKFWREMHELAAAKTLFASEPVVISVLFDDAVKEGLYAAETAAFDAVLRLPETDYGRVLRDRCRQLTTEYLSAGSGPVARRRQEAYDLLDRLTGEDSPALDRPFREAFEQFRKALHALLDTRKDETRSLWQGIRQWVRRPVRRDDWDAATTTIRRGLAKLLLFEEAYRGTVIQAVLRGTPLPAPPEYGETLGLTQSLSLGPKTITRVTDSDLIRAVRQAGQESLTQILQDAPLARMEVQYLRPIRELAVSGQLLDAIITHRERLGNPELMAMLLRTCAEDPAAAAREVGATTTTRRNWLIDGVMTLARISSSRRQGYGYPALAEDCGVPEFARLPGLTISQYDSRRQAIPPEHLTRLAAGLSKRLAILSPGLARSRENTALEQATHLLETRLIPYRLFDPVGTLVRLALARLPQVCCETVARHRTALTEYAGVRAATTKLLLATRKGRAPVALAWQAPNKNPRDKMKEFCGRIAMLRQCWDQAGHTFRPRAFRACLFIADGAWTEQQRHELVRFGFDAVLSPADLGKLAGYFA